MGLKGWSSSRQISVKLKLSEKHFPDMYDKASKRILPVDNLKTCNCHQKNKFFVENKSENHLNIFQISVI